MILVLWQLRAGDALSFTRCAAVLRISAIVQLNTELFSGPVVEPSGHGQVVIFLKMIEHPTAPIGIASREERPPDIPQFSYAELRRRCKLSELLLTRSAGSSHSSTRR
jgi:hypothetical protein